MGVERGHVVALVVPLDANGRATQRVQAVDQIELLLGETLARDPGLPRLQLDDRLGLDLVGRLRGERRGDTDAQGGEYSEFGHDGAPSSPW